MNPATATTTTTPATDAFCAAFPAFLARRKGSEPAWLSAARENAYASFVERGLPTRHQESWKYLNLKPIAERSFRSPDAAAVPTASRVSEVAPPASDSIDTLRVVLLDGRLCRPPSSFAAPPQGVAIESLFDALAADPERFRAILETVAPADHSFAALNAAFLEDGVAVTIAANTTVAHAIEIVSLTSGAGVAHHPRIVVTLGASAHATLIETHANLAPGASLSNVVTDVRLGDGAILEHVRVGEESPDSFRISLTRVDLDGRDSTYRSRSLTFGGAIVRDSIVVRLAGKGSSCDLDGLYVASGTQQHDHYTLIDHAVPHTTSTQHYKGVLDGRSRGTFFGRVIVRPDAQKADAAQSNNNLLLSGDALCNSTPQLEILADDVKCKHGSTIGQLDGGMIHYLRSRGLTREAARELLTYAFANEILDRMTTEPLRERLSARLTKQPPSEHVDSNPDQD